MSSENKYTIVLDRIIKIADVFKLNRSASIITDDDILSSMEILFETNFKSEIKDEPENFKVVKKFLNDRYPDKKFSSKAISCLCTVDGNRETIPDIDLSGESIKQHHKKILQIAVLFMKSTKKNTLTGIHMLRTITETIFKGYDIPLGKNYGIPVVNSPSDLEKTKKYVKSILIDSDLRYDKHFVNFFHNFNY